MNLIFLSLRDRYLSANQFATHAFIFLKLWIRNIEEKFWENYYNDKRKKSDRDLKVKS